MKFYSIASSSAGNCYLVDDGQTKILLECGLPIARIRKVVGNLSQVSACLVSHLHKDHSRSCTALMQHAVDVYGPENLGLNGHRWHPVVPGEIFQAGSFMVKSFSAVHDVPCLGYILQSGKDKLLFLIDSAYCPCKIEGLTHIAIECNYDRQTLHERVAAGQMSGDEVKRIVANHFGLESLVEMLKANDLSELWEIHLLHMSDRNGNEERILGTIKEATGAPVFVARK